MEYDIKNIEKTIRKAMKNEGTYSKSLELSIALCAGSYLAFLKARDAVAELDTVCSIRRSREGNEYKVVNPEFYAMQNAAEQTRKALRELRLTRATIENTGADDEVEELINSVTSIHNEE